MSKQMSYSWNRGPWKKMFRRRHIQIQIHIFLEQMHPNWGMIYALQEIFKYIKLININDI